MADVCLFSYIYDEVIRSYDDNQPEDFRVIQRTYGLSSYTMRRYDPMIICCPHQLNSGHTPSGKMTPEAGRGEKCDVGLSDRYYAKLRGNTGK